MKYTSKAIYEASSRMLNRASKEPNNMRVMMEAEPELKAAFENFINRCAKNAGIRPGTLEYESLFISLLYGFSLRGELDTIPVPKPSM